MSDDRFDDLPQAEVEEGKSRISIVWLVPLVALVIGGWLVYKTLSEEGPTIAVEFSTAEGITAQKTKVKYLNVEIGQVQEVTIKPDATGVVLNIEMDKGVEPWLTDKTRFWVVRPRIGAGGVSGIDTLLSGAYIGIDPSKKGRPMKHFVGLKEPPNIFSRTAGTRYRIRSREAHFPAGSPVLFRGVKVGEVTRSQLAGDHTHVETDIFILAPHDQYVYRDSRFWNASGVDLKLGVEGLEVDTGSLAAIISGGIAFDTPDHEKNSVRAAKDTEFTLFKNREQSLEKQITNSIPYILEFEESVRGLSAGAPVEFRGIRLGTVRKIEFNPEPSNGENFIAVYIDLEPQRIPVYPDKEAPQEAGTADRMEVWVRKGLRARLQTGNLLTGALFVELDIHSDAAPASIQFTEQGIPILPTIPGKLASMTDSLTKVLHKLETLPIEEIGRNLEQTTIGINELVNSQEVKQTLDGLRDAAQRLAPLLERADRISGELEALGRTSNQVMQKADATLGALDAAASGDGPVGGQLVRTLEELRSATRAIRVMAEYLERHPEALLKGKRGQ